MTETRSIRVLPAWLLAWVMLLAGCSQPEEPTLRVGTYPWPGFATLHHARALGLLDPARVRLVDFDTGGQVMQAMRDGSIDAAGLTLNEALLVAGSVRGTRVVLAFGQSAGGDTLLARPPIIHLRDLRGKRVGVESGAEGGYILARAMDRAGLGDGDLEIVELSLEEHEKAYRGNAVDAVITMDPVRSRLVAAGANELFSSRQIAGELVDVLLVGERVPDTHRRALQSLAGAHFRALDSIRADPAEAASRLPQRFGSPAQLQHSWTLVDFFGRGANLRLLEKGALQHNADLVRNVMLRRGLLKGDSVPRLELDPRIVADANL